MKTEEMIEVMQAFADGKEIQARTVGTSASWFNASNPTWNWERFDYRANREPLVLYVNIYNSYCGHACKTRKEAERLQAPGLIRTIKMKEVIEDD